MAYIESINKAKSKYEIHFASAQSWVEYAAKGLENKGTFNYDTEQVIKGFMTDDYSHSEWNGYRNGEQNTKRIINREVNQETATAIHAAPMELYASNAQQEESTYSLYADEQGIAFDANAYFNGDENCMLNYDLQEQARPIVTISSFIGATAGADKQEFIKL
jgi:hypothetical protein